MKNRMLTAFLLSIMSLANISCGPLINFVGGASSRSPADYPEHLSPAARKLAHDAYADTDPAKLADYHVHLIGLQGDGSGCYANPKMLTWAHPFDHLRFLVYCSAGGVTHPDHAAAEYFKRLNDLALTAPGRFLLLAFDENRGPDGNVDRYKSEFYVPNDYALAMAAKAPDHFAAAGSVHPLRPDAIADLRRLHSQGVRVIKWLPNAMGIDPADPRCEPFYREMNRLDMALLTHGGEEAAVDAAKDQRLGNPQRLKLALNCGVKVIVAHCASLGKGDDEQAGPGAPMVENWRLLFRMMDNPQWRGLLFADISATAQLNRSPEFMRTILTRTDLHPRLVNGTDYPLPATNIVISLRHWVRAGLLDPADVTPLRELYHVNPLIFDYTLKRRLRVTHPDGPPSRLPPSVFQENPSLPLQQHRKS